MHTHWSQFVPNMLTRHPKTLSSISSSWAQLFCRELSCAVRRISDAIVSSVRYIPVRAETTQEGVVSLERPRTDSDHAADTGVKLSPVETNEGHIYLFLNKNAVPLVAELSTKGTATSRYVYSLHLICHRLTYV